VHADTLRVTGAEAVIVGERRPPLIAVTFHAYGDVPQVSYLLEALPAFDLADGIARLAAEIDPLAIHKALLDRLAPPAPLTLPHDL
jgi:hypothetical protein